MKVLIFALIALAAVNAERDWSKIRYREINPFTRKINTWAESRVVGGEEVIPNSRPFQAGLFIESSAGTYFCGGSLIDSKHVLTAAHCLDVEGFSQVEVILGAHKIRELEPTQVRQVSSQIKIHLGWIAILLINDMAVITLPEAVETNEHIQIVKMPRYSDVANDFNGESATVSGWGKDSDEATAISPVLRKVSAAVLTNARCNDYYFGIVGDGHICSDGADKVGSCSGDSGGPLTIESDAVVTQLGIVSFGVSLGCEIGFPSVYTRLTHYLGWIVANSEAQIDE